LQRASAGRRCKPAVTVACFGKLPLQSLPVRARGFFFSDLLTSGQLVSKTRDKIKKQKNFSLSATFPKPAMSNGQKNKF